MSTMTIRNIDDDLKARLRIRAAENGRSMEADVRQVLRDALDASSNDRGLGTLIHEHFADIGGVELDIPVRDSPVRYVDFSERSFSTRMSSRNSCVRRRLHRLKTGSTDNCDAICM